jgi:hypothetical protein
MILQISFTLIYRIVLETSGAGNPSDCRAPLAGFRRLRFSFFADEHAPGALRLCDTSGAMHPALGRLCLADCSEQDPDPHFTNQH